MTRKFVLRCIMREKCIVDNIGLIKAVAEIFSIMICFCINIYIYIYNTDLYTTYEIYIDIYTHISSC